MKKSLMLCPECNSEMKQTDTTRSTVKTERAEIGQHTGNIYHCSECGGSFIENLLEGGKIEVFAL